MLIPSSIIGPAVSADIKNKINPITNMLNLKSFGQEAASAVFNNILQSIQHIPTQTESDYLIKVLNELHRMPRPYLFPTFAESNLVNALINRWGTSVPKLIDVFPRLDKLNTLPGSVWQHLIESQPLSFFDGISDEVLPTQLRSFKESCNKFYSGLVEFQKKSGSNVEIKDGVINLKTTSKDSGILTVVRIEKACRLCLNNNLDFSDPDFVSKLHILVVNDIYPK